jgi:hypothetical protein
VVPSRRAVALACLKRGSEMSSVVFMLASLYDMGTHINVLIEFVENARVHEEEFCGRNFNVALSV